MGEDKVGDKKIPFITTSFPSTVALLDIYRAIAPVIKAKRPNTNSSGPKGSGYGLNGTNANAAAVPKADGSTKKPRPGGGDAPLGRTNRRIFYTEAGGKPVPYSPRPMKTKLGTGAVVVVWGFAHGLNLYANWRVRRDFKNAEKQFYGCVMPSITIVEEALIRGELSGFDEKQIMDIANYIYQGTFVNEYEDKKFKAMKMVAVKLMKENDIDVRPETPTEQVIETPPLIESDNTRVD